MIEGRIPDSRLRTRTEFWLVGTGVIRETPEEVDGQLEVHARCDVFIYEKDISNEPWFERLMREQRNFKKGLNPTQDPDVVAALEAHLKPSKHRLSEPTADPDELERRLRELRKLGKVERPEGQKKPRKFLAQDRTVYERDPNVILWVLQLADGRCELCKQAAPFNKPDGEPYLEVHHVWQLAHDGPDTDDNAVALCPNCHRRLHHAADRDEQREKLYSTVGRLKRKPQGR